MLLSVASVVIIEDSQTRCIYISLSLISADLWRIFFKTRFLCASELPNLLGQTIYAIEEVVNCDRLSRQLRLLLLILLLKLICKQHEFVLLCTRLLEELLN